MNQLKNIVFLSALALGVGHAGTVPCNGFKINFKNKLAQEVIVDKVSFIGGNVSTVDPVVISPDHQLMFTVNQTVENGVMLGEFYFHAPTEPNKQLKINFSLTNKMMVCEFGNYTSQGTLDTSVKRLLGGIAFQIKN